MKLHLHNAPPANLIQSCAARSGARGYRLRVNEVWYEHSVIITPWAVVAWLHSAGAAPTDAAAARPEKAAHTTPAEAARPEKLAAANHTVRAVADLTEADFQRLAEYAVAEFSPEVILLGGGARGVFPSPVVTRPLLQKRLGLEIMSTPAAARTYNALAGDGRRVLAACIL